MRAIQVDAYGGPEVLKVAEVADPAAGPRQVVVPPYVPGNGVAGVVVSLGDGADRRWLGRQVVAVTAAAGKG